MKKILLSTFLMIAFIPSIVFAATTWAGSGFMGTVGVNGTNYYSNTSLNQTQGSTYSSQSTGVPNGVNQYVPLEPLSPNGKYQNFADYLGTVYKLLITIGSLIAVVMLVLGGVRYMLSESFTDIDKAKKRIKNAIWGLTILVGSFLILYTINPNLLNFNLALNPENQTASQFTSATGGGANASCSIQCPSGYYCDPTTKYCTVNAYKNVAQNQQACAAMGGVAWETGLTSSYCQLKYTDQGSCTAAGGTWYSPWLGSAYCYTLNTQQ